MSPRTMVVVIMMTSTATNPIDPSMAQAFHLSDVALPWLRLLT